MCENHYIFSLPFFLFLRVFLKKKIKIEHQQTVVKKDALRQEKMAEMTKEALLQACKRNSGYAPPHLNDQLYLHCKGFMKIENLEPYTELKALWLEQNCIGDLRGLSAQQKLVSLMINNNALITLQSFDAPLSNLRILNISHNYLTSLKGIALLCPQLETLQASHNHISSLGACEDLRELSATLTSVDLSFNEISSCCVCSTEEERSREKKSVNLVTKDALSPFRTLDKSNTRLFHNESFHAAAVEMIDDGEKITNERGEEDLHTVGSPASATHPRLDSNCGTSYHFPSPSSEATAEVVKFFQTHLPHASVLYLHGNTLLRGLKRYRQEMIAGLPSLTYLDERPVFAEERRVVEAWARGGEAEESSERNKIREEKKAHLQSCVQILTDKMEANREVRDRLTREWEKRRDLALEEAALRRRKVREAKGVLEVRETAERDLKEKDESSSWLDLMEEFEVEHGVMEKEEKKRFHTYQYEQELASVTAEAQRELDEMEKEEMKKEASLTNTPSGGLAYCDDDGIAYPLQNTACDKECDEVETKQSSSPYSSSSSKKENNNLPIVCQTDFALQSSPTCPTDPSHSSLYMKSTFFDLVRSDDDILMEMEREIQNVLHQVHTSVTAKRETNMTTPDSQSLPSRVSAIISGGKNVKDGAYYSDPNHEGSDASTVKDNTVLLKEMANHHTLTRKLNREQGPNDANAELVNSSVELSTASTNEENVSPLSFLWTDSSSTSPKKIVNQCCSSGTATISCDAFHSRKEDGKLESEKGDERVHRAVKITAERLRNQAQKRREGRWKEFKKWEDRHLGIPTSGCER